MTQDTRKNSGAEAVLMPMGAMSVEGKIRQRVRPWIEAIIEEEVEAVLGATLSQRTETRGGYRHGTRERTLTTSLGPTTIHMPRARLQQADGSTTEWHSQAVRRYQRRTELVDEAILGVYLSGTNTRRIKGALAPLLRGGWDGWRAISKHGGRGTWRPMRFST